MRYIITCLAALALCYSSCKNSQPKDPVKQDTPKALQEKSFSSEIITKRRFDNLVESLYDELAEKTPVLKAFEDSVTKLYEDKSDSLELYQSFDNKSINYYTEAKKFDENIKDSLLKEKVKLLIEKSLTNYKNHVSKHEEILALINTKNASLNDLHNALKIIKTLPLMEEYQQKNLPSVNALKAIDDRYHKVISKADSLVGH